MKGLGGGESQGQEGAPACVRPGWAGQAQPHLHIGGVAAGLCEDAWRCRGRQVPILQARRVPVRLQQSQQVLGWVGRDRLWAESGIQDPRPILPISQPLPSILPLYRAIRPPEPCLVELLRTRESPAPIPGTPAAHPDPLVWGLCLALVPALRPSVSSGLGSMPSIPA